jgi:cyclic beta-1,2-glucan synthetase
MSISTRAGTSSTGIDLRKFTGLLLCVAAIVAMFAPPALPGAALLTATAGIAGLTLAAGLPVGAAAGMRVVAVTALALFGYAQGVSSAVAPWQVPATWHDLLLFSRAGGACAAMSCLGGTALLLRGPLPPALRQLCAWWLLPYAFNALLVLASPGLLSEAGRPFALGPLAGMEAALGRLVVLAALTTLLVLALGFIMDARGLRAWRAWLLLGACIAAAALAPWLAALGASPVLARAPLLVALPAVLAAAALSQAALWAQAFVATGAVLDLLRHRRPTADALAAHAGRGARAGAKFGLLFMAIMLALSGVVHAGTLRAIGSAAPLLSGALAGALLFGLAHAIIESSDASHAFFRRLRGHVTNPASLARGAVTGMALGLAAQRGLPGADDGTRALFGLLAGALCYAGVELLRDALAMARARRQRLEGFRAYAWQAAVGGFVGAALAWYFDRAQLVEVTTRLLRFSTINFAAAGEAAYPMVVYPLFSKWGAIDLGVVSGGVKLLYDQSLAGLINWALAAPLFSLNLCALNALLSGSSLPLRRVATREGLVEIVEQAVRVLRWGLWMAPIIFAFLKVAPEPTWYNQDGALRSLLAVGQSLRLEPAAFAAWSRDVFLGLLAYDWLRCLIWFDHMGLRVATLVNFSFVGLDWLERRWSRALGYGRGARIIPEGLRRFCTWAPLLIPFYLPRGADWDYAWNGAERLQGAASPLLPAVADVLAVYVGVALCGVIAAWLSRRRAPSGIAQVPASPPGLALPYRLGNGLVALQLAQDGRGFVQALHGGAQEIDLTRRPLHPCDGRGPWFFLVEPARGRCTRLTGFTITRPRADTLLLRWAAEDLRIDIEVTTAPDAALLYWRLRLDNRGPARPVEILSWRELALNGMEAAERAPAFNQLHIGTEFAPGANALLAHNRLLAPRAGDAHAVAVHALLPGAAEVRLLGYQDARARLDACTRGACPDATHFRPIDDAGLAYTFEPVAALRAGCELPAAGACELVFVDGHAPSRASALALLGARASGDEPATRALEARPAAGYGFSDDGCEFTTGTVTPRPWTQVLANAQGYGALFSNLGDHCSFALNAQQNMLTPFTCDAVAPAAPGRVFYACDLTSGRIDSAGHAPCRHADTRYETCFGLGYVVQRSIGETLEFSVTSFVVDDAPLEIALVTLHNRSRQARRYRVVPYAELLLAEIRRGSHGLLEFGPDLGPRALGFRNRHNGYAPGLGFMAVTATPVAWECVGARFVGAARDLAAPAFVGTGAPADAVDDDGYRVAACALEFDVPAGGTLDTAVLFGFAASATEASTLVARYAETAQARAAFAATRNAWRARLGVLRLRTGDPAFDRLVNLWLPYQALTARLWGRIGPEQRSGAFGYRDQLQDVLPFTVLDPALARAQILAHAAHQFRAGDAVKWWHPAPAGETSLGARTRASDPHLWLPYLVFEYVAATGDASLLDATAPFIDGPPVPRGEEGLGFVPRRSREQASLFEHCRRAIEHSLARLGPRGLPLIGTGDWNDGFDALGTGGRGESGWLALFLVRILGEFARHAEQRGEPATAARWRAAAGALVAALEATRHDGAYLRASDDDGRAFAVVDALMGAWPALSGAAPLADAARALEDALAVLEQDTLVCVMQPATDAASVPWPGRVATYPPGVRENGGQYSHGVSWLIDAACALAEGYADAGDVARATHWQAVAARLWRKISPLLNTGPERIAHYGQPPYQQAADVYFGPGYAGRGGWTAYTGAASRMLWAAYRLAGLRFENGKVSRRAAPQAAWPGVLDVEFRGRTVTLPER